MKESVWIKRHVSEDPHADLDVWEGFSEEVTFKRIPTGWGGFGQRKEGERPLQTEVSTCAKAQGQEVI